MAMKCTSLCEEIRQDAANVIRQCRQLAAESRSGTVRVRLAQLAEYAELLQAEPIARPIRFNGRSD
jgi:hypothetical protein